MKQTQNQFYGKESELPRALAPGSIYFSTDTKSLWMFGSEGIAFKVVGKDSYYSKYDNLSDTEESKSGKSGKYLRVSDDESIIEYVDVVVPADGIGISEQALNYSSLNPGNEIGLIAYVEESEGTKWLPGTIGGSYYPQGFYIWNGSSWESDRNAIAQQFQTLIIQMESKVDDAVSDGVLRGRIDGSWQPIEGSVGEDGKSAYEVALDNGFVGTEQEWLDSLKGDNGVDGVNGTNGVNGNDGDIGPTGPAGQKGDDGDQGIQGVQGPEGDQGPPGNDGSNGNDGNDGLSAYELAVNNGFSGTESEWLDSLVGEDGTNGNNGTNGTNGQEGDSAYDVWINEGNSGTEQDFLDSLQGIQGIQGEVGDTGPQGLIGNEGPQGEPGVDGENGVNGSNGADGANGTNGVDGNGIVSTVDNGDGTFTINFSDNTSFTTSDFTGVNGNNGIDGIDGNDGTNGIDGLGFTGGNYNTGSGVVTFTSNDGLGFATGDLRGADGADGSNGADGNDGTNGTNGTNGTDGADGQGVSRGGSAGQVLEKVDGTDYNTQWVTPSGGGSGTTINFFQIQDNSGAGQTPPTTYGDVNSSIWGTAFTGTGFSWDGSELTVSDASDAIEFNVSIQGITTLNNRVELGVRLMEDTGSGYNTLTTVTQYALRNNTQNEGNVTLVSFYAFNVAAGTKYKIQINRSGVSCVIGTQGGTYFNAKRFS